jgi:hypothetical protein
VANRPRTSSGDCALTRGAITHLEITGQRDSDKAALTGQARRKLSFRAGWGKLDSSQTSAHPFANQTPLSVVYDAGAGSAAGRRDGRVGCDRTGASAAAVAASLSLSESIYPRFPRYSYWTQIRGLD